MSALDTARTALPVWVAWLLPVTYLVVVGLASRLLAGTAVAFARRPLDACGDVHWTERARHAWPARVTGSACVVLFPLVFGRFAPPFVGPLGAIDASALGLAAALVAFFGALAAHRPTLARLGLDARLGTWLRNAATVVVVLAFQYVVAVAAGFVMPHAFDTTAVCLLGGVALAVVALSLGSGLLLGRLLGLVRPASPRLTTIVAAAATRAGVRPRSVHELRTTTANAFAFPLARRLAFTSGALAHLDDDALTAVTAHELAHLVEPAPLQTVRTVAAVSFVLLLASIPLTTAAFGPFGSLATLFLAWGVLLAARRVQLRAEWRADRAARDHEAGAGDYARALEAIGRANAMPVVLATRATSHPPLYDRLVAAGVTPDYPRPLPPSRWRGPGAMLAAAAGALALSVALPFAQVHGVAALIARAPLLAAALARPDDGLVLLGATSEAADPARALLFYRAAAELTPDHAEPLARAAVVLARTGQCEEAFRTLTAAALRTADRDRATPATTAAARALVAPPCGPSDSDD